MISSKLYKVVIRMVCGACLEFENVSEEEYKVFTRHMYSLDEYDGPFAVIRGYRIRVNNVSYYHACVEEKVCKC